MSVFVVEFKGIPCQVAGVVPTGSSDGQFDITSAFKASELNEMSLGTCYALVAAEEALKDSKWFPTSEHDCERTGTQLKL